MIENKLDIISHSCESHIKIVDATLLRHKESIVETADLICSSIRRGGKVVLFGNGGSAADAQHIAAEFVGRFLTERSSLPAFALTTDPSVVTAIANDYGYNHIFARQVEALVNCDDVVVAISTSGNSENVVEGVQAAIKKGATAVALSGNGGGRLHDMANILIDVPSSDTPRIQEVYVLIGHLICELVENDLLK